MRLLIITQKADRDDPILGFFHRWIEEFAAHAESVIVICLEEGRHELPKNVKVLSLGKSKSRIQNQKSKIRDSRFTKKIRYAARFFSLIWRERADYDTVFVHMNPIYVVLAGAFWKMSGKKVALWYVHRTVDLKLRIAAALSDVIFSSTKEGFRIRTDKVRFAGHGIDAAAFGSAARAKKIGTEPICLLHVGRITPIKNCDVLVNAAALLEKERPGRFKVAFIGSPVTEGDRAYDHGIKELVGRSGLSGMVSFVGSARPQDMPERYAAADASVNLTPTGGLDKAVLESMASGVPAFSSNRAYADYFGRHAGDLLFGERDASDLARRIIGLFDQGNAGAVGADLQRTARERADIRILIGTIVGEMAV